MGAQNKRFSTIGDINLVEESRIRKQKQLDQGKNMKDRRALGQFATPPELAKEIVSYGLSLQNNKKLSFLEPAMGTGAFYSALLSECEKKSRGIENATGIELDDDFWFAATNLWKDTGINIVHGDFTETECFRSADILISNPPYVRHHYIPKEKKEKLSAAAKEETGLSVSGLAGLYCYFILLAHKWLAPGAVCGWLIPSEFMDVNYGNTVKQYLLEKVHLLRIHRYDPKYCKFDDALVSSCVVWFRNEMVPGDYEVEFSFGGTHEKPKRSAIVSKSVLTDTKKWTRINEGGCGTSVCSDSGVTLGDLFTIKRGIATGDNSFFVLSKEQIDHFGLDMTFFTPILPSPRHLDCDEVFSDANGFPCLEPRVFLFSSTLPKEEMRKKYPAVWTYLCSGEETTAKKYLCRNRKIWYSQETRLAAPFLCSYMGRGRVEHAAPFRFILNHTNAVATNSYLMLYPKDGLRRAIERSPENLKKIWMALNAITASDLECEGRVYGGGLKKIEPRELACVKCPKLTTIVSEQFEFGCR